MPIRSGAMQRPSGCSYGNTLRQRYDEGGLPCSSTMGSPAPPSTYAISRPRTRRRCFLYGNAAEITFASPSLSMDAFRYSTPCRHEGALREALPERDVLARELIELDQQIVWRNAGAGDDPRVQLP